MSKITKKQHTKIMSDVQKAIDNLVEQYPHFGNYLPKTVSEHTVNFDALPFIHIRYGFKMGAQSGFTTDQLAQTYCQSDLIASELYRRCNEMQNKIVQLAMSDMRPNGSLSDAKFCGQKICVHSAIPEGLIIMGQKTYSDVRVRAPMLCWMGN